MGEAGERLLLGDLTGRVLGAAIDVHRELGPGLLESTYRACLFHHLATSGFQVQREVPVKVAFRGIEIDCGYRADLVVERQVILELKSVDHLLPIHEAQLLTYLKLSGLRVGLLMNFNESSLKKGLRRFVR